MKSNLKVMTIAAYLFIVTALFASPVFAENMSVEKSLSYKFAEYFSGKDINHMDSILDDNIVVYDPGKVTTGKENFLNLLQGNFTKTNTIVFRVLHVYQEGNTTVLEFKLAFDNNKYNGVDIFTWKDNKIVEIRCYYYPSA
jgi:ketosteroid isomerase-like protein